MNFEGTPPKVWGDFQGKGFSIRLYIGAGPFVEGIDIEIRGDEDIVSWLRIFARATGWIIVAADRSQVAP